MSLVSGAFLGDQGDISEVTRVLHLVQGAGKVLMELVPFEAKVLSILGASHVTKRN